MTYEIIKVPLISVNDDKATVVQWLVQNGEYVKAGQRICILETTKSVFEAEAKKNGTIYLVADENDEVEVNSPLAWVSDVELDHQEIDSTNAKLKSVLTNEITRGWTKKAEILARKNNIEIRLVPSQDNIVREKDVESYISENTESANDRGDLIKNYAGNEERILIIGGGKAALMIADILLQNINQRVVGILDDDPSASRKTIFGVNVWGTVGDIKQFHEQGLFDSAVISFSRDIELRKRIFDDIVLLGVRFTNAIDQSVIIHRNVKIGQGNVIFGNSRMATFSEIGNNNFINSYVNIEHHNIIGSHCTIGPGTMMSGEVLIGSKVKFGTGVFVEPNIVIGDSCVVSSGCVITGDIPEQSIVKREVNHRIVSAS